MIRIDSLWLCAQPQDMRAGAERLLAVVVNTLGQARAHHGYLFANARATRVKLLVPDGFGIWCAARRLHAGRFVWLPASADTPVALELSRTQFDALVLGLPWQRLPQLEMITRA
jgi:transposase